MGGSRSVRIILIAAAIFGIAYIALDCNALYALRANQNTGLYLQSAVDFARTGSTFDQPDGKPHLLVHDQWLFYALCAPLVALWPRPETLIVVQVLALAASAIVLYRLGVASGVGAASAACLGIAFLISPSVQGWAYDGFVPEDFVPLVAFGLALAVRRRSIAGTLVCAQLLLGIKEDEAYFLAWLGLIGAIWFERRLGTCVLLLALVNGAGYYFIATHLGGAPEHPRYALSDREWFGQATFILEMLVPLAFAPLRLGRKLFIALPFFGELFFTQDRSYPLYHIGSYYTVPLVVLATIGTVWVSARRPATPRYALAGALIMALFFNHASVVHLGRGPFTLDPQYAAARSWATTSKRVDIPCDDVGAWTVASADLQARLVGCGPRALSHGRPAWRDRALGSTAAWTRGAGVGAAP